MKSILINSALLSAQNRERYYRTNIPGITQPQDKGILLKDILLDTVDEKYYLTDSQIKTIQRNFGAKGKILNQSNSLVEKPTFPSRIKQIEGLDIKCPTLCTAMGTGGGNVPCIIQKVGDRDKNNRGIHTDKSYCLPANPMSDRGQLVLELPCGTQLGNSKQFGNSFGSQKAYTLRASNPNGVIEGAKPPKIRKLTPIECERLQTLPDDYTEGVSNTQRYKMLGNGWTVDIISHIFSFIK